MLTHNKKQAKIIKKKCFAALYEPSNPKEDTMRVKRTKKLTGTLLLASCLAGAMFMGCNQYNHLSASKLKALKLAAVRGDGEAANELSFYYGYILDDTNTLHWASIGAENGYLYATLYLVIILTGEKADDEVIARRIFWLFILDDVFGYDIDYSFNLEEIGYSVETARPPGDNLFPHVTALSEYDVDRYKEGALKGSGQAALVLANYLNTGGDAEETEYWYRIGAQNGNRECMRQYGEILLGKKDMLDQERGKFWLNRF